MQKEVYINMRKKILLAVAAMSMIVAVSLTGCGGTSVADPDASASESPSVSSMALSDINEDNLNGMLTYLKGNGVIKEETREMKAEIIGAIAGQMVEAIYDSNSVYVEIYEFDLTNLNERAAEVLANAKENGKFTSLGGEMTAAVSNDGRFLMLYKDVFTDETNGPIQERILQLFKEFSPTGTASSDASSTVTESTNSESNSSEVENTSDSEELSHAEENAVSNEAAA